MKCDVCQINHQMSYASMYCEECYLSTCSTCRTKFRLWDDNMSLLSCRDQQIVMSAEQAARERSAGYAGEVGKHKHKWIYFPSGSWVLNYRR